MLLQLLLAVWCSPSAPLAVATTYGANEAQKRARHSTFTSVLKEWLDYHQASTRVLLGLLPELRPARILKQ